MKIPEKGLIVVTPRIGKKITFDNVNAVSGLYTEERNETFLRRFGNMDNRSSRIHG